jgi:aminoglycoside phosphotransferase (APT) family kinase protein
VDDDAYEIAARFGLMGCAHLTGPLAHGHQGEVWRLQTDQGEWAVKRGFRWLMEADVAEPAALQEAALAGGVATPRILRSVEGTVLADVALGQVRVEGWVDLADPDDRIDPEAVGELCAAMHRLTLTGHLSLEPVGAQQWMDLAAELVSVRAPFAEQVLAARDELVAMDALVEPPRQLQTCHRDLWADNVRTAPDGRVWVIDWQDSGPADPSYELAALLFEYCYDDARRARALYGAYVAAGGPGRVERPADFSMAIAQLGHILEISCRRWLASMASAEHRAINQARVAEFADKPLARDLIERILDAIRN